MAQKKFTRFACNECEVLGEQLESDDESVVKFRCNRCGKQWEFHHDENGRLHYAVITYSDGRTVTRYKDIQDIKP